MSWCLKLFFVNLFLLNAKFSAAESKDEIDRMAKQKKGQIPIEKSTTLINNDDLGFYNSENSTFTKKPLDSAVDGLLGGSSFYENLLFVRIACAGESALPVTVPYKFKDLTWEISNGKAYDVSGGKVQTDSEGKARITFKSKGNIKGQTAVISTEFQKIEISLIRGPFTIFLPMRFCKNK